MSILKDLIFINKNTFKKSFKLFLSNWQLIFTGFIYSILNIILFIIIGILSRVPIVGLIMGIVMSIATSAMISDYFYLLNNIIKYGKFSWKDFKDGFKVYLWKVYHVFFIAWIASYMFDIFISPIIYSLNTSAYIINFIISFLILVLLNALPESIYQKFYSSWESIIYSFNFIRENWIEWFIPNVILMAIVYFTTGRIMNDLFAINISFGFDISIKGLILYIIGQILFSFIMIYRGVLFELLSTSTRRKRMFMKDFYK